MFHNLRNNCFFYVLKRILKSTKNQIYIKHEKYQQSYTILSLIAHIINIITKYHINYYYFVNLNFEVASK